MEREERNEYLLTEQLRIRREDQITSLRTALPYIAGAIAITAAALGTLAGAIYLISQRTAN